MAASKAPKFNIIPASDVKVAPRGRKVQTDPILTEALAALTPDQAIDLSPLFDKVNGTAERQKVGATIRKNWKAVRSDVCKIDFGTDGVPMVRVNVEKSARLAAEAADA